MNIRPQVSSRLVIVYLLAIPLLSLFIEVSWGITHGLLAGYSLEKDPAFNHAINKFLKERGLDLSQTEGDSRTRLRNMMSAEDKAELEKIIRKYQVVTFGSIFLASALAFGLIGFLTAILTSSWIFVGLLPLASFTLNNPITRYAITADIPLAKNLFLVSVAQFGASYLFAYLGAKLRIRRPKIRLAAP